MTHSFGQKRGHARTIDIDEYKVAATRPQSERKQDSKGKSLMPYKSQIQGYKMTAQIFLKKSGGLCVWFGFGLDLANMHLGI